MMYDSLTLNMRSVYPGAKGETQGTAPNTTVQAATTPEVKGASEPKTNPLIWWGILIALFVGLMFLGKQVGGVEPFSNVKMSAYNVVIITLCALIGLSGLKALAVRYKIDGLSELIISA